ncbi:Uncharacterized protein TCM_024998 [Theobroma cacao]|uniref:Uncharacterized protein n=1 Tax=Theobroma cacao TaxID=3641 RepID=A0A061EY28_THECC|nr:Uncharacterized protein TCM_024998 [Theobroma cacao]
MVMFFSTFYSMPTNDILYSNQPPRNRICLRSDRISQRAPTLVLSREHRYPKTTGSVLPGEHTRMVLPKEHHVGCSSGSIDPWSQIGASQARPGEGGRI